MKTTIKTILTFFILSGLAVTVQAQVPDMKMTTPIPTSVSTPDKVETSIGTLNFFDGVWRPSTVNLLK